MVTIKPERLLELCVDRYEAGGRGLTSMAKHDGTGEHQTPYRRSLLSPPHK